jgi:hypothetical protein
MDIIKKCDIYPTISCNCTGNCKLHQAKEETKQRELEAEKAKQKFIEDLIDFQFFLRDEGYINDEDWAYEDEAIKFYNQNKAYESNQS